MALSYKGGDAPKPVPAPRPSALNNVPAPFLALHRAVVALVPGVYKRWQNIPKATPTKGAK